MSTIDRFAGSVGSRAKDTLPTIFSYGPAAPNPLPPSTSVRDAISTRVTSAWAEPSAKAASAIMVSEHRRANGFMVSLPADGAKHAEEIRACPDEPDTYSAVIVLTNLIRGFTGRSTTHRRWINHVEA